MSSAGTRAAIKAERAKVRAKVIPEIEAHWKEVEARQALDAAESRAIVATHREREVQREQRRREREEAEDRAYEEVLTEASESVLLNSAAVGRTRSGGSPKSMEGQMAKLDKKAATKAAAAKAPAAKAAKASTFCLMTGKPTNGTRFSGLGTDAKYKSLLINTALGDPHGEVTVYDNATGQAEKRTAISVLKSLNWMPFLDKARASRKAKVEAKNEASAKKVAKQPSKKAAGTA